MLFLIPLCLYVLPYKVSGAQDKWVQGSHVVFMLIKQSLGSLVHLF